MRNLRRSRWHREIARLLTVLMLLPPMLLTLPGRPAQGQTKIKTVAVMDFENPTGRQGLALGRKAGDALALALDNYDVVLREQVEKQMAALGLTPPLDRTSLIKLGRDMEEGLGLTEIFTGRVLKADVTKGSPRQALVRIEVRVLDVESEEFTNGAVAEGISTPRYDDVSSDVLVDDAVQKAAFAVVRRLASQVIPQGAVKGNSRGEILINRGTRDGIRTGMQLIVLRGKEKVARIAVVDATDRDATCAVKEQTRGVMVEDIVRPIYTSVGGSGTLTDMGGRRVGKSLNWATIGGVVGGIILGLVTIKLIKTKNHVNQGPVDVRAAAALDGNGQPAVRISWVKPSTPAAPDLLGFKIYRSRTQYGNYEVVQEVAGPFEQLYYDTTDTRTISVTTAGGTTTTSTSLQVLGVEPGVTYYYRVSRVYLEQSGTGGTGGGVAYTVMESDMSTPSPGATPVQKPVPQSPLQTETIDPANVTFRWFSAGGGDVYRIEVADNAAFSGSTVYRTSETDSLMQLPGGTANQTMSRTLNLSGVFPSVDPVTGQTYVRTLFWRVGARHRADGQAPEGGYIFSDGVSVQTQELPPTQPTQ